MMKMTGRVMICCVALLLVLTSVSAVQTKIDSINGLKKINFGHSVPKHSLLLLYWFANTVDIDNNDIISLTFDPNGGDYGSHHYGNFEGLLDPLPRGNVYRYYTIGNLNQATSMPLPPYVVRPQTEYVGSNRDRIIIRVREQNTGSRALQSIDQVYITQHYDTSENLGTPYDPDHTYRITTNLMRQIRQFSVGENQLLQLRNNFGSNANVSHIRNEWGDLACLGLLLFIVIKEKSSIHRPNNRPKNRSHRDDTAAKETNVPRGSRNQDYVVVNFNDYEDQNASRTIRNREPGVDNTSPPQNNTRRWICCICVCCIATIVVISLCAILALWYKGQLK